MVLLLKIPSFKEFLTSQRLLTSKAQQFSDKIDNNGWIVRQKSVSPAGQLYVCYKYSDQCSGLQQHRDYGD